MVEYVRNWVSLGFIVFISLCYTLYVIQGVPILVRCESMGSIRGDAVILNVMPSNTT
jgi:hypothetical protein